jgi:hypothetical protein
LHSEKISLLDLVGYRSNDWYVVYRARTPYYWFTNLWKQGFRHVEVMRPISYGPGLNEQMWLCVKPNFEFLEVDIDCDPTPPWIRDPACTVQRVTAHRKLNTIRDIFFIGPQTCVEVVKACLGIRSFWLRTPYQLYRYIKKRNGVIKS